MAVVNSFAKFYGAKYPLESDVRAGSPNYGDAINVLVPTLDVTGDPPIFPSVNDVRLGTTFGTQSNPTQFTGTVREAPEANVLLDYLYGANDTLRGQLQPGSGVSLPAEGDVRLGITYGEGQVGNLVLPSTLDVLLDVSYGALGIELTGEFVCDTTNIVEGDMTIIRGDDYLGANAFVWEDPGDWDDLTGAALLWEMVYEEELTVLSLTPTYQAGRVSLEVRSEDTSNLASRVYRYGLRATLADGSVRTLARGNVRLAMAYADEPDPPAN